MLNPAYVAGVVDGEGCAVLKFSSKQSRSLVCALEITNSHRPMLEAIQAAFGGKMYGHDVQPPRTRLKTWRLRFTGAELDVILEAIGPYVIVKAEQVAILQEARATLMRPNRSGFPALTDIDVLARAVLIENLKRARKNGVVAWV